MQKLNVTIEEEAYQLKNPFRIARGVVSEGEVIVVTVSEGSHSGRGESCPTEHYGESVQGVIALVRQIGKRLEAGESWKVIHDEIPAGAARNAVDCAIWDYEAKKSGLRIWSLLAMPAPHAVRSVLTLSLDEPGAMARAAKAAADHSILKLKLGAEGDDLRVKAIREAVPDKRLVVDVNEGWTESNLTSNLEAMSRYRVEMVEQPLPAGKDSCLAEFKHPVPVCADESCHVAEDLERLKPLYEVVNIKLDKTGGLTEAMRLVKRAQELEMDIMIGCMLGTSLAMAPGVLVGQFARFVDLDAPLLLKGDRTNPLVYRGEMIEPASPELWG